MIVCSCNVITDHKVRATLLGREGVPRSMGEIYQFLGCNARCGRCARTIRSIMDEILVTSAVMHDLPVTTAAIT